MTFGDQAIVQTNGNVIVTDDPNLLAQTPEQLADDLENVGGDDLPTIVPLPPENPVFIKAIHNDRKTQTALQAGGVLPPIMVAGTWPPPGTPPPPGDRPVVIFRFMGARDLNLGNWTVNGPAARRRRGCRFHRKPWLRRQWQDRQERDESEHHQHRRQDQPRGERDAEPAGWRQRRIGQIGLRDGQWRRRREIRELPNDRGAGGVDLTNGTLTLNPGKGGGGGEATVTKGAAGGAGCPGAMGASSTAHGGRGGDNTKRLFVRGNVQGIANMSIGICSGGDGGKARADACDGGPGIACCKGGPGGAAKATGGRGGNASVNVGALPVSVAGVFGGDGGNADATGGNGGDGGDCKFGDGGDGGAGGPATAMGGMGGTASGGAFVTLGGNGGDASATGGNGGAGGDSGFGNPGKGGAGGSPAATKGSAGSGSPSGVDGQENPKIGEKGPDGMKSATTVFCFGFSFLPDPTPPSSPVPPGVYQGPVFASDNVTQIGTLSVEFRNIAGAQYQTQNNPVKHVGISNGGQLDIHVSSLQLNGGAQAGVIGGLRIVPLFGNGLSESNPLVVLAMDAQGEVVGSKSFASFPDNFATPTNPQAVDAGFDVPQSVATFRIVTPPGSLVTIIRVYLLDP